MRLDGIDEVQNNFNAFKNSGSTAIGEFLNVISTNAIKLLKDNTPVDTGELRDSWRELNRGNNSVEIGVSDDQEEKLYYVVNGTRYVQANPFMDDVDETINTLIYITMAPALQRSHPFWHQVNRNVVPMNISKTVGTGGMKYNSRRSFGRAGLSKPQRGGKGLRARVGRRRRVGSTINNKRNKRIQLG